MKEAALVLLLQKEVTSIARRELVRVWRVKNGAVFAAAAAHLQVHGSQVQLSPHLQPFSAPISATS